MVMLFGAKADCSFFTAGVSYGEAVITGLPKGRNERMKQVLIHPIEPLYSTESRILILGSFPSVKSREQQFFYGHPQNRFWKVMAAVCGEPVPESVPEKKELILGHGFALWDTVASCEITGSSDASIRNVRANDLRVILDRCPIEKICCNGKTSYATYHQLIEPDLHREAVCLPSTSPANAQWSLEKLIAVWDDTLHRETGPGPGG